MPEQHPFLPTAVSAAQEAIEAYDAASFAPEGDPEDAAVEAEVAEATLTLDAEEQARNHAISTFSTAVIHLNEAHAAVENALVVAVERLRARPEMTWSEVSDFLANETTDEVLAHVPLDMLDAHVRRVFNDPYEALERMPASVLELAVERQMESMDTHDLVEGLDEPDILDAMGPDGFIRALRYRGDIADTDEVQSTLSDIADELDNFESTEVGDVVSLAEELARRIRSAADELF